MKYWKETVALQLMEKLYLQGQFKVAMYIVTHTNCNFATASNTVLSYAVIQFYHVHAYVQKIYDAKFYCNPIYTAVSFILQK